MSAIDILDLSYAYADGTQALHQVRLRVEEGESVGLVGPNGAGKSTLLLHLNGSLSNGHGGRVTINGLAAVPKNLKEIRTRVGIVFQDPDDQLFCPTVFEDVAFGPLNAGFTGTALQEKVNLALDAVGMPRGIGRRLTHHLSFGEKKRVAIATVLSMDVTILALDEPSSNLDPAARRGLIAFLQSLKLTKIIATHDLEMALQVCRRVVLIDAGRIIADGPAAEILANEDLMETHRLEVPLSLQRGFGAVIPSRLQRFPALSSAPPGWVPPGPAPGNPRGK